MSIRGLVFDFGGVLVRMIDDRPRIALANKIGISLSRLDELVFLSETAAKASKGEISVTMHWTLYEKRSASNLRICRISCSNIGLRMM